MKTSAGILLYRRSDGGLEVLLVHPGGPFFAGKDAGIWTIPKGLLEAGEEAVSTALREFEEETGFARPTSEPIALGSVRQKSGKVVHAWALEGDADLNQFHSNTCEIEWPPRSGKTIEIPEADRAQWFSLKEARRKILPAQTPFLDRLVEKMDASSRATPSKPGDK